MNKKTSTPIAIIIIVLCAVLIGEVAIWQYLKVAELKITEPGSKFKELISNCEKIETGSMRTFCTLSFCEAVRPVKERIKECNERDYTQEPGYRSEEDYYFYGTYRNKDSCINSIVPKTIEVCDAFSNEWISFKNRCYNDLAKKKEDEAMCEKIDDLRFRIECFKKLARMKKNPELCKKIDYNYFENWCLENPNANLCDYYLSRYKENTERHSQDKAWCLAVAEGDSSKCASLGDYKASCYSALALDNNDLSLCDKFPEQKGLYIASSGTYKDACYMAIAELRKDISLCKDIDNEYGVRDKCYMKASKEIDGSFCEEGNLSGYLYKYHCYPYIAKENKDISLCPKAGQDIFTCFSSLLESTIGDLSGKLDLNSETYNNYCKENTLYQYLTSGDFYLEQMYGEQEEIEEEKNFEWQIYRDESFAFEIDYPSTWRVHSSWGGEFDEFLQTKEFSFSFLPSGPDPEMGGGFSPLGGTSIHIGIRRNSKRLSVEDFYLQEREKLDKEFREFGGKRVYIWSDYFFSEKEPVLIDINGETAYRFENIPFISGYPSDYPIDPSEFTFVIIGKDDLIFEISMSENLGFFPSAYSSEEITEIFNQMISSFKFIEVSEECRYKKGEYEMRVYDSQGRVTGLVNGEEKREIPDSFYFSETENLPQKVIIYNPEDSYVYEIYGLTQGTYRHWPTSTREGIDISFYAYHIPIYSGETHQYHFDWEVLARDEEGARLLIDSDNDGVFEKEIKSDNMLTCEEFLKKIEELE